MRIIKHYKDHPEKDPMPKDVKQVFFPHEVPPDLLREYDVIGFAVDHCLVKFNLQ